MARTAQGIGMELVVDTDIVISALLKAGMARALVFRPSLLLISPTRLLEELAEHRKELLAKSGMDESGYEQTASLVLSNISIVTRAEYSPFDSDAETISPDKDDAPFFAVALYRNCQIWSNEKRLKNQEKVVVCNTSELNGLLLQDNASFEEQL